MSFIKVHVLLTAGLEEQALQSEMIVYPNPANTELNVLGSGYFYMYDLNGREVLNKKLNESLTKISLQNIESGMYLCKMIDEKGNVMRAKIVKE